MDDSHFSAANMWVYLKLRSDIKVRQFSILHEHLVPFTQVQLYKFSKVDQCTLDVCKTGVVNICFIVMSINFLFNYLLFFNTNKINLVPCQIGAQHVQCTRIIRLIYLLIELRKTANWFFNSLTRTINEVILKRRTNYVLTPIPWHQFFFTYQCQVPPSRNEFFKIEQLSQNQTSSVIYSIEYVQYWFYSLSHLGRASKQAFI